jgi:cold shock CspA family protein
MSYEDVDGLIKYEKNGEIFYVGYSSKNLINPNEQIKVDDQVRFQIAQSMQNGPISARNIELHQPIRHFYYGIIKTMKDTFGRIEREDLDREILFHFTEYRGGNINDIRVGSNVQFEIQDKYVSQIRFANIVVELVGKTS